MVKKNLSSGVSHGGPSSCSEHRDRGDEQRVVGERREELRRHDRVEAALHGGPARGAGSAGRAVHGPPVAQLRRGQRRADDVALREVAAQRGEGLADLPRPRTPSATTRRPKLCPRSITRAHERPVARVGEHAGDERPVDLELVDGEALEVRRATRSRSRSRRSRVCTPTAFRRVRMAIERSASAIMELSAISSMSVARVDAPGLDALVDDRGQLAVGEGAHRQVHRRSADPVPLRLPLPRPAAAPR